MKSVVLFLVAAVATTGFANDKCYDGKSITIPAMTFQIQANGQGILTQVVSKMEITNGYKWMFDGEGAGWVETSFRSEDIKVEFDAVNNLIRVPEQTFQLKYIPLFKSPKPYCRELPHYFYFKANYKPEYDDDHAQGTEYGKNKKYAYNYNMVYMPNDGLKKAFKTDEVNVVPLPPNQRFFGRISGTKDLYLSVLGDDKINYLTVWMPKKDRECLVKLASSNSDVEVYGSYRGSPEYHLLDVYDIGVDTEKLCN